MTEPRFRVGDAVVLASAGLGRVVGYASRGAAGKPVPCSEGTSPDFYVVEVADNVACVPLAQAGETLREPMDKSTAARARDILLGPAAEPALESMLDRGRRIAHAGDPLGSARFLRELYELKGALPEALASGVRFYQRVLLPEVAFSLGVTEDEIVNELRGKYPAAFDPGAVRFHAP